MYFSLKKISINHVMLWDNPLYPLLGQSLYSLKSAAFAGYSIFANQIKSIFDSENATFTRFLAMLG